MSSFITFGRDYKDTKTFHRRERGTPPLFSEKLSFSLLLFISKS
ncbi:hypothetical protein HMPREF1860_01550 [Prevotella amnii]|uniref:Uncharacterized protein n=1 Tax=Prevotella amnii TaxID=419005 RepID=A0A134B9K6_9BACT|nr:hypothetical protein HMPREF1860_01550 [Prevotella amnii]